MDKNKIGFLRKEMNKIIAPDNGELPSVSGKDDQVNRLQNFVRHNKEKLSALYRYAPADVYTLLSILNRNVYLMPASAMNDKLEGRVINRSAYDYGFGSKLKQFQKETYIKSFCAQEDSCDMWDRYADHHRGVCITYDFSKAEDSVIEHLFPVQYSDVPFSCMKPRNLENKEYFYLRKSTEWENEHEWRLIYKEGTFTDRNISLPITEITFGACMSEDLEKSIIHAITACCMDPAVCPKFSKEEVSHQVMHRTLAL